LKSPEEKEKVEELIVELVEEEDIEPVIVRLKRMSRDG